jgi:spermidine/putrescine transport system ATP-binding protein
MNPDPSEPMVELRGVSKRYGDLIAVRDVSLTIRRGEFLTLLGPSGCGKTTLLRMLAGFETPDAGCVLIDGEDVTALPPNRRNVNQVFQSYALFPHLTVWENIAFGLQMKRLPKSEITVKVRRAVGLVALTGKEDAKPATLSGGQKQRVALARAIVCEPKVLLLDEPLSALDAKLRGQMQVELKTLQRTLGITFVFVTHAQEEALTMSDRIAVLHRGAIEQLGTADEIYHRPQTRFVAEFIGQANLFTATVSAREGSDALLTLGGELTLRANVSAIPAEAKSVGISIRPEKIRLCDDGVVVENSFAAEISGVLFRGELLQLTVRTAGGVTLVVVVVNAGGARLPHREGDRVRCAIHRDDIVLVDGV